MDEQNNNGVGSSCPVCGVPVATEETASHALTHESGFEKEAGNGENHETMPPSPMDGGMTETPPEEIPPVPPMPNV